MEDMNSTPPRKWFMSVREKMERMRLGFVILIFGQIFAGGQTLPQMEDAGKWHREKIQAEEAKLALLVEAIRKEAWEIRRLASESKDLRETLNQLRKELENDAAGSFRFSPLRSLPREEFPSGDYDVRIFENSHG